LFHFEWSLDNRSHFQLREGEVMNRRGMVFVALAFFSSVAVGGPKEDMQRQLNQEVMDSEFDAGDPQRAQAYADEAIKKGIKPVAAGPSYWQPGWTCSNLIGSAYYRYADYRNCIYYHRYYGRYW
jgi:hypothetical protein